MTRAADTPLYGLDIETDTAVDGLDPRVGRVLAVAVASADGSTVFDDGDERVLLDRLDFHLAGLEPGVLVTWNGAAFDLPYLLDRADRAGLTLGLRLRADAQLTLRRPPLAGHASAYRAAWHAHGHLDAYRLYRSGVVPALRISGSLKSVARTFGLRPVTVDASRIHEVERSHLATYVASDATCTRELAARRWPAARASVDRVPESAPHAPGGAVRSLELRARAQRARPSRAEGAVVRGEVLR